MFNYIDKLKVLTDEFRRYVNMQREREFMIYVTFTKQKKNSQSLEKNFSLLPPLPNDGQTFSGFFNGDLVQSDFEDNTQNPCK